jgi:uncharacterized membrane protein YebE (DUF533 family)
MSLGNLLGQLVQNGMGGSAPSQRRVESAREHMGNSGLGGILGQVQDALNRSGINTGSVGQGGSGIADQAKAWLGKEQVGGLSGAKVGGIGALAGAVLGGGIGGAAKGGALAVLGTLALGALRNAQANQHATAGEAAAHPDALPPVADAESVVAPEMERLVIRAMLGAAKADNQIDQQELAAIFGKLEESSVTAEERQFLMEEMAKPVDVQALAAEVRTPAQAAEIYAASLVAIHVDTEDERRFLANLASALGLDEATVSELHKLTGTAA